MLVIGGLAMKRLTFVLILVACVPAWAQATPILGAQASIFISGSPTAIDSETNDNGVAIAVAIQGPGAASAESSFGVLRGSASMGVDFGLSQRVRFDGGSQSVATWTDDFTITSGGLAVGTLVSFLVSQSFSGFIDTGNLPDTAYGNLDIIASELASGRLWWRGLGVTFGNNDRLDEWELSDYTYYAGCNFDDAACGNREITTRTRTSP
jgi:hypothetical protein